MKGELMAAPGDNLIRLTGGSEFGAHTPLVNRAGRFLPGSQRPVCTAVGLTLRTSPSRGGRSRSGTVVPADPV